MLFSRIRGSAALAVVGLSVSLAVSACGSDTVPADNGGADSAGVERAKQQLAKYSQVIAPYIPAEKLSNPAALKGKKIMYIPAVASIPFFATSWKAVQAAFSAAGVDAEICDGKADPSVTSACLDQARNNGDAGIIMDALSPAIAQQSFDAVVKAGIPVVLGNIPAPDGSPATVVTVGPDTTLAVELAADSIIAASNGKATVVAVKDTDSPVTQSWYDNGIKEFGTNCPGCKVKTVETKTADLQSLPSKVSAAILAQPGTNYLLPELSPVAPATIQGAKDAGQTAMPAASTATTFSDLQQVANGQNLSTTVGWDVVLTSWYEADALNRLVLGQHVDTTKYVSAVRVFTKDNVTSLDITQNGWDTSNWFGGDAYQDAFRKLWK